MLGCYDGFIYVVDKENGDQIGRIPGAGKMVLGLAVAGNKVSISFVLETISYILFAVCHLSLIFFRLLNILVYRSLACEKHIEIKLHTIH